MICKAFLAVLSMNLILPCSPLFHSDGYFGLKTYLHQINRFTCRYMDVYYVWGTNVLCWTKKLHYQVGLEGMPSNTTSLSLALVDLGPWFTYPDHYLLKCMRNGLCHKNIASRSQNIASRSQNFWSRASKLTISHPTSLKKKTRKRSWKYGWSSLLMVGMIRLIIWNFFQNTTLDTHLHKLPTPLHDFFEQTIHAVHS